MAVKGRPLSRLNLFLIFGRHLLRTICKCYGQIPEEQPERIKKVDFNTEIIVKS